MSQIVQLRNRPELKFIFNSTEFEIVDAADPKNNGVYAYSAVESIELRKEQTNWLFSIFTHALDLLIGDAGAGAGGNYKTKAHFNIKQNTKSFKVWLLDIDNLKAEKIPELFLKKKNALTL